MNKELEALILSAAKALGIGVVGVNPERARDFGVPVGTFVKKGSLIPGSRTTAKTGGYYCYRQRGKKPPKKMLLVDSDDFPGYGHRYYAIAVLVEANAAHWSFSGQHRGFSLSEMKAYLRGVADSAKFSRRPS